MAFSKLRCIPIAYATTFFLTLTNPITILSYAVVFEGLGISNISTNYIEASLVVLGVFIGSVLWWFLLSMGVDLFRKKLVSEGLVKVNRISGIVITAIGFFAFISLLK